MNQGNEADNLNADNYENTRLPQGINVLTILTFIGCGLVGLVAACLSALNDFILKYIDDKLTSGAYHTAKEVAAAEKTKASIELTQQHIIPLVSVGLIGVALCVVGALWMRKLRKDGFWLYIAGELAPVIVYGFIMGIDEFKSTGGILRILIPVIFVALYASQRKYLTK